MPTVVEYLAVVPHPNSFGDSVPTLKNLLRADSRIVLNGDEVWFEGTRICAAQIFVEQVPEKEQRYFHLHFTWAGDPESTPAQLEPFLALLKAVRTAVMEKVRGELTTLWDDLSKYYGCRAYPLIHDIENVMRRLIGSFMLTRVGCEWTKETLPPPVAEALRSREGKGDAKGHTNALHRLDFIHLGTFLFAPYSNYRTQELDARVQALCAKPRESRTPDDVQELLPYVHQSNWKRYFASIVDCDDSYLDSRWKKLYELRCKVAHNTLMVAQDVDDIEQTIAEVKPILENAIRRLSKVTVPREEVELVAESAARTASTAAAEFLDAWRDLDVVIVVRLNRLGKGTLPQAPTGHDLARFGIIDPSQIQIYDDMHRTRVLVLQGAPDIPAAVLQRYVAELGYLVDDIDAGNHL